MVEFFLGRGVNVNATARTDRAGHTALMAAASQPNTAMVKLLLQHGADPNMATDTAGVGGRNGPLALKRSDRAHDRSHVWLAGIDPCVDQCSRHCQRQ